MHYLVPAPLLFSSWSVPCLQLWDFQEIRFLILWYVVMMEFLWVSQSRANASRGCRSSWNNTDDRNITDYLGIKARRFSLPSIISFTTSKLIYTLNTTKKARIFQKVHPKSCKLIWKENMLKNTGLLIYCWKTWLFGETQKTQHCLSSASICILLTVTLWVLFRCYKQNCQISSWYQGKGRILIPKMKLHCDMVKLWFFGNWKNYTVMSDVVTVKPWSGYAITYAACPICWLPDKVTAKWDIPKAS